VNGNRADQGGAASAGRKSVGCTSIPARSRTTSLELTELRHLGGKEAKRRAKGADRRQTTGRKALTAFSAPLAIVAW